MLISILLLVCAKLLCGGAPEELRAWIEAQAAGKKIPGAVVLVQREGRTVFAATAGFADIAAVRPMRADDIFMMASSTKPVSTTAILTLVDQGKLRLEDPVSRFFPEFKGASTIHQLLSHTSGIFGNDGPPEAVRWIRDFDRSLEDSVEGTLRQPLAYEPGKKFSYGGASFGVAGRIVEMLSGTEYEAYMKRAVLDPLGMRHTCFRSAEDLSARIPVIYRRAASGFEPMPAVMERPGRRGPRPDGFVLVAGGIYSTAEDVLRFLTMHLNGGAFQGRRILSESLVREMQKKQTGSLSTEYGLGWFRHDSTPAGEAIVVGHGGAYGTDIWIDNQKRLAAAVLVQMPSSEARAFQQELRNRIRSVF